MNEDERLFLEEAFSKAAGRKLRLEPIGPDVVEVDAEGFESMVKLLQKNAADIASMTAQRDSQINYSIVLQQMIEDLAAGRQVRVTGKAPHLSDLALKAHEKLAAAQLAMQSVFGQLNDWYAEGSCAKEPDLLRAIVTLEPWCK